MKNPFLFLRRIVKNDQYGPIEPASAGITLGVMLGFGLAVYTALAAYTGYGIEAETIFESFMPGYSLTLAGGIVGVVWAFSAGYLFGSIGAWVYDKLVETT
jgi:hypothetical protein